MASTESFIKAKQVTPLLLLKAPLWQPEAELSQAPVIQELFMFCAES